MTLKNYYELLEIAPAAPVDEVKRAFRQKIAKYHPDKVQHLGKEFQDMAAERAAELTEAYRVLSHDERRAEYDRLLSASGPPPPASSQPAASAPPPAGDTAAAPPPPAAESGKTRGPQFSRERATKDEFVRKALLGRFRQALDVVAADYDRADVRGFDIACNPKSKLFSRHKGPRLLGRFVPRVDAESLADAWMQAAKSGAANEEICVFLIGSDVAPAGQLAAAIAEQRRKVRGAKVTLIPIDARDWEAHMPIDAPPIAKTLITRLQTGV